MDGPEYLFKVGLAILVITENELLKLDFEDMILYLKNKVVGLDSYVLEVADSFGGVEALLVTIDQEYSKNLLNSSQ